MSEPALKLPLRVERPCTALVSVWDANDRLIFLCDVEDAREIVRRVNAFDEMQQSLKAVPEWAAEWALRKSLTIAKEEAR